jgi:hypothetical protein
MTARPTAIAPAGASAAASAASIAALMPACSARVPASMFSRVMRLRPPLPSV